MIRARVLAVPFLVLSASLAQAESRSLDLRGIEGDYKVRVHLEMSTGDKYTAKDELRIVRHGREAAFVSVFLNFLNGHECYLSGIAAVQGRSLIYRAPSIVRPPSGSAPECRLQVNVGRDRITFDDEGYRCQSQTCGPRGHYYGAAFRLSTRRPLRNAAAVRHSEEFTKAVETFEALPPEASAPGR